MRGGVEKQIEYVESRLYWNGFINHSLIQSASANFTKQTDVQIACRHELASANAGHEHSRNSYAIADSLCPAVAQSDA